MGMELGVYVDPFPKTRGVIVAEGLGVAEGLQHRVGQHNLLLDRR